MKHSGPILARCLLGALSSIAATTSPVTLANPLQGTDSNPGFSHGNEYPAIAWRPLRLPCRVAAHYSPGPTVSG